MLFDVVFLGFPVAIAICLVSVAMRESEAKFWRPAFCLMAYSAFYLFGGREVLLYLSCAALIGHGWLGSGGLSPEL